MMCLYCGMADLLYFILHTDLARPRSPLPTLKRKVQKFSTYSYLSACRAHNTQIYRLSKHHKENDYKARNTYFLHWLEMVQKRLKMFVESFVAMIFYVATNMPINRSIDQSQSRITCS
jgi:hypothetical protein